MLLKGLALAGLAAAMVCAAEKTPDERLQNAADTFREIMATPDKGIPQDLLGRAQCVVIIPGLKKGAFVVGGEYGKGFAECRTGNGWSGPAAVKMTGGSFGFQIGGSETDLVLLVMNQRGMDKLMSNKFTLGADASVAAGPVGRTAAAETDASMHAEILAWSRSRGAFAGIALNGAVLQPDESEDRKLYGHDVSSRDVLAGSARRSVATNPLTAALEAYPANAGNADRSR
ncbi:MAG TPA: lipid-binding SYLF domain-containing protein [Bryobacteraceae bacterium]|nr:lipid-binding SYLF domain-containing protein [Bryobacteraceae bacterium]